MQLNDQKKGMLLAFTAIVFIAPDSLLIRLSNTESPARMICFIKSLIIYN